MLHVVLHFTHHTPPSILVEHRPSEETVVGTIDWPYVQPAETYDIAVNADVSLQLDTKFPVRLASIAARNVDTSAELLRTLVGETVTVAMQAAPTVGLCTLQLALSKENRLAIARLQLANAHTPPGIQRACRTLISYATLDTSLIA